ncbi:MAG: hypothetical protein ABI378_00695 [Chitinophagaceae bacterium]
MNPTSARSKFGIFGIINHAMKTLLVSCLMAICLWSCGAPPAKTTIATKETEQAHPTDFLKVNFEVRKNLLGKKIVEGEVINTGKNLGYSSVTLRISCTKDGDETNTEYTVSEAIPPGGKANFSYKPDGNPQQVKVSIASATAE